MKPKLFRSEKLCDRVTRIFGITDEIMYLIEGGEKAMLVDTGVGIGKLKDYVESLTDKPVTVVLTHGHIDHAMGGREFDEVYLAKEDFPIYMADGAIESRNEYVKMMLGIIFGKDKDIFSTFESEDFINPDFETDKPFSVLEIGRVFNLGGVHVRVLDAKGHTPGSIALLIEEERMLIMGDAGNTNTFLFFEGCSSIEEYKDDMLRLKSETEGKYDRVLLSHGNGDVKNDLIDSLIELCDDIMSGNVDDETYYFMGSPALLAKSRDGNFKRIDGGTANIIYSKDNVFRKG
ncbi:MAG: MBL fold metallo-hydrolase [Clostridia bacterium]|nr:MBL fold metallo-hydrolase [Clostridia bacterium]